MNNEKYIKESNPGDSWEGVGGEGEHKGEAAHAEPWLPGRNSLSS